MPSWKSDLDKLFSDQHEKKTKTQQREAEGKKEIEQFMSEVVRPAFEQLKPALEQHGRSVEIYSSGISVHFNGILELDYRVEAKIWPDSIFVYPKERYRIEGQTYSVEGKMYKNSSHESVTKKVRTEDIIKDFMNSYSRVIR